MQKETFDVLGMTCAACQANVTRAVSRLPGVESVDVSLLANTMKVEYDASQVDEAQIVAAVDEIGYQALPKKQILNEAQPVSIRTEWETRQKRMEEEIKERRQALVLSLVLLAALMVFSMLPMLGIFSFLMDMKWMMVSAICQLIFCMLILFFQRSFFVHGFKALIKKAPNMDSLVALGSAASFGYGIWGILSMAYGYGVMDHHIIHQAMDALYFEGAAMIVTLVSLGKYLEARSKMKTGDALGKLVDLAPKTAMIEKDGVEMQIPAEEVHAGDVVIIRPGQRIPVDGIVKSGVGFVDQAALTGESIPVEKQPGDSVLSASININGTFRFEATKVGADTTLAQIIRLVDEAGNSKAPIARLADKVAGVFVPVVIGLALLTFAGWLLANQGFGFALSNAICVLVISCPCALGLATPLAIMVATGKAAEYGVLVKSAQSLETLHSIQTVILDKTGTITSGKPAVMDVQVFEKGYDSDSFLALAASVEMGSEHPLGKAVVEKAQALNLPLQEVSSFQAISGRGLEAIVKGQNIAAGNLAFMQEKNIPVSQTVRQALENLAKRGQTPLLFAADGTMLGMIGVADAVRPTSQAALQVLKDMGIETVMLTGDNAQTAKAIAAGLAVDEVISDVLPQEKENVVARFQAQGKKTAMVGDGINDAPALMRADVGIAIGAGTDIAIESADIVLMKDNLMDVATAIQLSRKTIANIKENLFWAFFYNCLGIPVAMGLLYPLFGLLLNPMWGAAAMSFSSVTVCLNALRLRLFRPKDETPQEIAAQQVTPAQVQSAIEKEDNAISVLEEQATDQEKDSLLLQVTGMSCAHCSMRVKQALKQVPGVELVQVSLEEQEALVEGKNLDPAGLIGAVEEAGYEASLKKEEPLLYTLKVEGMMCDHCKTRLEKALDLADGVEKAHADVKAGQIVLEATKPLDLTAIRQVIEDTGYEPAQSWEKEEQQ